MKFAEGEKKEGEGDRGGGGAVMILLAALNGMAGVMGVGVWGKSCYFTRK